MIEALFQYLADIEAAHRRGNDTEHTHRPALKALLEALAPDVAVTNEPRRIACGAPDLAVTRRPEDLIVGYVEAKDIGLSLDEAAQSEQIRKRYLPALANFLLTDYLEFRWFVEGVERGRARLASPEADGRLRPLADADGPAVALPLLQAFLSRAPLRITGAEELARRLARLTHLIRDTIAAAFRADQATPLLADWRTVFAETLLPELAQAGRENEFADMFAQTLAYGLFSARVMGAPSRRFTLAEAGALIPRTNPFLRDFFDLITGPKLADEPFAGFVQDLVTLLDAADMTAVLEDFGRGIAQSGRRRDPVVHFYETFLQAYDPRLRELRGVYYTPEPVVSYIVESVDAVLRNDFGLKDGLADKTQFAFHHADERGRPVEEMAHRVLILDPAAGTGTFLFEVVERIRERFERKHQAGAWSAYVHDHLLPRLFGFELLMAPYSVAHFKLALELSGRHLPELWRKPWEYHVQPDERLHVYLTNTLADVEAVTQHLGPLAILSREANEAVAVKTRRPVLVVIGNPPYANFGRQNRNDFILGLLDDYKRGLREKKLNLDDDFIKFLRWAQWRVERTGQGVVGFITNNVYLDGLTHRRMRECLLEAFDDIYIVNLHGSSKKQETTPEGGKDENVFDITVGVAIAIFVKRPPGTKRPPPAGARRAGKPHAVLHYADVWGLRPAKYEWLNGHNTESTEWTDFEPDALDFFFRPRNAKYEREWNKGWSLREAFPISGNGIKTERDGISIHFTRKEIQKAVSDFRLLDESDIRRKYLLHEDSRDWSVDRAKKDVIETKGAEGFERILYRPFDFRHTWYSGKSKGFIGTPAASLMRHLNGKENLALCCLRQSRRGQTDAFFVASGLICKDVVSPFDISTVFPLYLYPDGKAEDQPDLVPHENGRRPNLAKDFVIEVENKLGLKFVPDGRGNLKKNFGPEDLFHYIYAVFHAPGYRERYAEFLKLDFPRIPLTGDPGLFRRLCERGTELVALHTMQTTGPDLVGFDIPGSNRVERVAYAPPRAAVRSGRAPEGDPALPTGPTGRVYINATQYFEGIPPPVWEFRIGGYQVAEKWLKDRKERVLDHDDIEHYQHTLAALAATREIMQRIDAIIADHGGWPLA